MKRILFLITLLIITVVNCSQAQVPRIINYQGMLLGADHTRISIFKDIEDSYECRLTGSQAQAMNHGLAILPKKKCLQKEILFVETNTKKTKRLVEKNE